MPNKLVKTLKISLMRRLFMFIALRGFIIFFYLFCFITRNTWVISWCFLGIINFFQKQSFFSSSCRKTGIKIIHITESGQLISAEFQKHKKSSLQNIQYSIKHSKRTLKVPYTSDFFNISSAALQQLRREIEICQELKEQIAQAGHTKRHFYNKQQLFLILEHFCITLEEFEQL